jgi:non-heme chloroperoxidase
VVVDRAQAKGRLGKRRVNVATTIGEYKLEQVERANRAGRQPVIFIHAPWLLPCSWDRWIERFEEAGYTALAPCCPEDRETAVEVGQVADYCETIVRALNKKPAVIGHSFGGLIAEMLAGRGCSAASVAIAPASLSTILSPLTFDRFHYLLANAVSEQEAKELYESFSVARPRAAWSEVRLEGNPNRGPLLVVAAEIDRTVPPLVAKAVYEIESRNAVVTEYVEMLGRGHSLTIDRGWHEVADLALSFVQRFAPPAVRA